MRVLIGSLSAVARTAVEGEVTTGSKAGVSSDWSFIRGTWKGVPTDSTAWSDVVEGKPRFLYCYMGSGEPTGEYYDFVRTGDTVVGKFRWFEQPEICGYVWFSIRKDFVLEGGWWMYDDVPEGHETKLPHVPGMVPLDWVRQSTELPSVRRERLRTLR
jgi:hypothetical protein